MSICLCASKLTAHVEYAEHFVEHILNIVSVLCITFSLSQKEERLLMKVLVNSCLSELLQAYKVREESLGEQVQVRDSVDCNGEQTLAVCDLLRGDAQTHDRQQEDD